MATMDRFTETLLGNNLRNYNWQTQAADHALTAAAERQRVREERYYAEREEMEQQIAHHVRLSASTVSPLTDHSWFDYKEETKPKVSQLTIKSIHIET